MNSTRSDRAGLLSDEATQAATDRIAWAMLVASGEQSPRKVWAERADEWRAYADGVWRSALEATYRVAATGGPYWCRGCGAYRDAPVCPICECETDLA